MRLFSLRFSGHDFERHFICYPAHRKVNPFCWAKIHCSGTSITYHPGIYFLFRDDDFQRENYRFKEKYINKCRKTKLGNKDQMIDPWYHQARSLRSAAFTLVWKKSLVLSEVSEEYSNIFPACRLAQYWILLRLKAITSELWLLRFWYCRALFLAGG